MNEVYAFVTLPWPLFLTRFQLDSFFEPSPQCFIISLGKRTVESESEKVSLSPHHSVVLWFVMMVCYVSMDDNIHHVHVFRPCSPGFLARGLCESESCGMVLYFL